MTHGIPMRTRSHRNFGVSDDDEDDTNYDVGVSTWYVAYERTSTYYYNYKIIYYTPYRQDSSSTGTLVIGNTVSTYIILMEISSQIQNRTEQNSSRSR
jgi:hypothetical protein